MKIIIFTHKMQLTASVINSCSTSYETRFFSSRKKQTKFKICKQNHSQNHSFVYTNSTTQLYSQYKNELNKKPVKSFLKAETFESNNMFKKSSHKPISVYSFSQIVQLNRQHYSSPASVPNAPIRSDKG